MQLENTNCRTVRNLKIIRDVLAGLPEEDVIVLEYFGGLNHLIWTKETDGHSESISLPIPTAWLAESGLESKLAETSRNFAACVLKARNDRRSDATQPKTIRELAGFTSQC